MSVDYKENFFDENEALGLNYKDAINFFEKNGYILRVTRKNGHACIVTRDYLPNRINVAIQDDIVIEIRGVG